MNVEFVLYEDKYKNEVIDLINKSFNNHHINNILIDDNVIGLVGLIDNKVVSYLNITICVDVVRNSKYSLINYVCVDDNYRGNNIGKSIMEKAISISKDNDCTLIKLTSNSKKVVANKMYLSMGFGIKETNLFEKVI